MICGKTLSYWLFKQSNEIYRGVPTTLDDIKTAPDLVICFVNYLSFHITQLSHKTNFKHILSATILIFDDALIGITGSEPSGKYKDI